jgi:MSHA biogenesis protein MshP
MSARLRHPQRRQGGFALIGAVFLLVVLAALGAFAVRINMTQQHDSDLELQQLRAEAALSSGIEYAAARLLASPANNCGNLAPLPNVAGGFQVTFPPPCTLVQYQVNGVPVNVYTVNVTSSRGAYGTPVFVLRRALQVRITS